MADYWYGNITIGGHIPAALIDPLMEQITSCGLNGDALLLSDLVENGGTINLEYDQARNGEFEELEEFLETHDISYNRYSSHCYEYNASEKKFRPGLNALETPLDADCEPFLTIYTVNRLIGQAAGDIKTFEKLVRLELGIDLLKLKPVTIEGQLIHSQPQMSADDLKKLNMDGRTECAQCGQKLSEPFTSIKYCPTCEGGS